MKQKGFIFNVLFMVYALAFQAPLARKMDAVMADRQAWISMAILLAILSVLEGMYLPIKIRNVFHRTGRNLSGNETAIWFMTPIIFRAVIGLAVAMTVFSLLVPNIRHKSILSTVAAVIVILLLLKELIVLFMALGTLIRSRPAPCRPALEWMGDTLLLAYSCIAYTLLTRPGFFFTKHQSLSMGMMPLIVFTFFAFLISLRLGFYVEEYLSASGVRDKIAVWGSLLAAAVSAWWGFAH